jgi:aspartate aminotransferase
MSIVASSLSRITASPTRAIAARATQLERDGRDIIALAAGEPDFDTPQHIRDAAVAAMNQGKTKYAPQGGVPELREAVCRKFKRENGLEFSPAQTLVTTGGKEALYLAMMASLDPGDEVLIPAPYWVSYPDMVRLAGGTATIVDTDPARGFALAPEALAAAITPRSKWLILNNPGNPTGALIDAEGLRAIAQVLREHPQVWVMTDDIYEHVLYDGASYHTIAQVAPDLAERTLTVNGLSKAYCMTGWRIGFAAGPRLIIDAMTKVQSQSTSCACTISQWAGVAALDGDQSFIARHNAIFQERRDLGLSILNQSNGLRCATPGGAFYLYVDCRGVMGKRTPLGKRLANDEDFVTYLLDSQGVAGVHGAAFGMSPFFRISYALATEQLEDACTRIQRACGELEAA